MRKPIRLHLDGSVVVPPNSESAYTCECVWDCGFPGCSLSGDPHVHPETGPCFVHPAAPGDLAGVVGGAR